MKNIGYWMIEHKSLTLWVGIKCNFLSFTTDYAALKFYNKDSADKFLNFLSHYGFESLSIGDNTTSEDFKNCKVTEHM